ncbi:Alpha/Beta hydrolase protein [Xylariomycetidae sp. FL2044]|nr:Alpha/Beta hydrolase protein [Xylariomycetidae sp. FL2044]
MVRSNPLRSVVYGVVIITALYALFIAVLTIPFFQNQVIYLNSVTLTWFQDVTVPEQWGFLRNQVTPFTLRTPDGETLHAWHILPLGLYAEHEEELLAEPSGVADNIKESMSFKLLRDDPESLLVLYFHGAAGTLGSGYRPPSYRAMSAGDPKRIHTVAIDYRGFGSSSGSPSEGGLLTDAITLAEWAMHEVGIPPSRIVLFSQSIGTAVSVSLAHHMAPRPEPVLFSGMVLVAPFADVERLTATYRVAGVVPLLDPIARFPRLLSYLNGFILSKWPSKDKIAQFVRLCEAIPSDRLNYHVTIIHAEDDYTIPWTHSEQVYWHAVDAARPAGVSFEELEKEEVARVERGAGGWMVEHRTKLGFIGEEIMKHGLHDRIMAHPVVSAAVLRAFQMGPRH